VARAFIVRPFGEKKFGEDEIAVNFDDVEAALIDPALKDLKSARSSPPASCIEKDAIKAMGSFLLNRFDTPGQRPGGSFTSIFSEATLAFPMLVSARFGADVHAMNRERENGRLQA